MNKKLFGVLLITIFLFTVLAAMILYRANHFQDSHSIDVFYEVTEKKHGFNLDTDALYMGKGIPGSMAKRDLNISNFYDFPINVIVKIEGSIAPYASVSDNSFTLDPGEEYVITYYIRTTTDTPTGNYSGKTTILYTKSLAK